MLMLTSGLSAFTGVLHRTSNQFCTIKFCNLTGLLFIQPSETLLGWSICSSSGSSLVTLKAKKKRKPSFLCLQKESLDSICVSDEGGKRVNFNICVEFGFVREL